jgi:hypothetical protein
MMNAMTSRLLKWASGSHGLGLAIGTEKAAPHHTA